MNSFTQIFRSRYFTWGLLAIPSIMMMRGYFYGDASAHDLLHPTGEFSARAMILALFATPLVTLFPKVKLFRSLLKRRRYIGVAAFGYGLLHTAFYVIDKGQLSAIINEILELSIWTGWIAFLIFVPLAITSNNLSMKALGARNWKNLQRLTYIAAVLTAAHWFFLEYETGPMLVHFLPLAILEIARIWKQQYTRS
jgi:methionine sulfoxide reductase heme-binding subunit